MFPGCLKEEDRNSRHSIDKALDCFSLSNKNVNGEKGKTVDDTFSLSSCCIFTSVLVESIDSVVQRIHCIHGLMCQDAEHFCA